MSDTQTKTQLKNALSINRADMIGWVNAELMKNGAEIGQLRMLRAATYT